MQVPQLPQQALEQIKEQLSQLHEEPVLEDSFHRWLELPITKILLLEFAKQYFEELSTDNNVLGGIVHSGPQIAGYRANPVEETAMNTATSEGAISVLEALLSWEPANLDVERDEDED